MRFRCGVCSFYVIGIPFPACKSISYTEVFFLVIFLTCCSWEIKHASWSLQYIIHDGLHLFRWCFHIHVFKSFKGWHWRCSGFFQWHGSLDVMLAFVSKSGHLDVTFIASADHCVLLQQLLPGWVSYVYIGCVSWCQIVNSHQLWVLWIWWDLRWWPMFRRFEKICNL